MYRRNIYRIVIDYLPKEDRTITFFFQYDKICFSFLRFSVYQNGTYNEDSSPSSGMISHAIPTFAIAAITGSAANYYFLPSDSLFYKTNEVFYLFYDWIALANLLYFSSGVIQHWCQAIVVYFMTTKCYHFKDNYVLCAPLWVSIWWMKY